MIEILSAGALNTVQDLGRYGHRKIGISVAGAMDQLALTVGNLLLGNPVESAGIEVTMFPFRVRFNKDTRIVVSGADCMAKLDGKGVLPWWTVPVRSGQVLVLNAPRRGSRAYLSIKNGIDVPIILNSRSTDLKGKFGGLEGRALKKGDRLNLFEDGSFRLPEHVVYGIEPPHIALPRVAGAKGTVAVRVLPAGEYTKFSKSGQALFWNSNWKITSNSNRQGYRLSGPVCPMEGQSELLSHGLVPGTIQVPPSGQPIIQLSDANPSGGYPKMGTVIDVDLWRVAQARLGDSLTFIEVTIEDAVSALKAERAWLQKIKASVASVAQAGELSAQ